LPLTHVTFLLAGRYFWNFPEIYPTNIRKERKECAEGGVELVSSGILIL
jgi:hypothetical protein